MNGFGAAVLVFVFIILAAAAGYLVVRLVVILIAGGNSIADLSQRVATGETSLTQTRSETAQVATSIINNITSNVKSNKVTVTGTYATAGDNSLVLTTDQVHIASSGEPDPARAAGWMYLTNGAGTGYADLGVGSMWADKGITVSPGSCIDFGGGTAMCGDGRGALTGQGTTTTGVRLIVAPGTAKVASNLGAVGGVSPSTRFPAADGTNQVVGDTKVAGDLSVAGTLTLGPTSSSSGTTPGLFLGPSGLGMAALTSAPTMTRLSVSLPDATSTATLGLGFSSLVGSSPTSDAISISRTSTTNTVKILGSFQVCEADGSSCKVYASSK